MTLKEFKTELQKKLRFAEKARDDYRETGCENLTVLWCGYIRALREALALSDKVE